MTVVLWVQARVTRPYEQEYLVWFYTGKGKKYIYDTNFNNDLREARCCRYMAPPRPLVPRAEVSRRGCRRRDVVLLLPPPWCGQAGRLQVRCRGAAERLPPAAEGAATLLASRTPVGGGGSGQRLPGRKMVLRWAVMVHRQSWALIS